MRMAWRSKKKAALQETVVEAEAGAPSVTETQAEGADGDVHVHRTIREWHPHAPETLHEIEDAIDSWGGFRSTETARQSIDLGNVSAKVDRLTKRVKGQRKVVVQETVTEWVEGPMGSGPVAVAEETVPAGGEEAGSRSRPRRRFRVLGFAGKKPKAGRAEADAGYQPQCAALTEDGAQCRNSSRHGSKYCSSHKGYQPPTAKGLAQRIEGDAWDPADGLTDRQSVATADTKPRVRKARDTKVKVRKSRTGRSAR
jgi:hypothetical protein